MIRRLRWFARRVVEHATASHRHDHDVGVVLLHGTAAPVAVGQDMLASIALGSSHPLCLGGRLASLEAWTSIRWVLVPT
jgi:hypothetical protein